MALKGVSKGSINSNSENDQKLSSPAENIEVKSTKSKTKIMGIKNYKSTLESERANIPEKRKSTNNLSKYPVSNKGDSEPIIVSETSSYEKKSSGNAVQKPSQFFKMSKGGTERKGLSQFAPVRTDEIDLQIKEMTPSESQKPVQEVQEREESSQRRLEIPDIEENQLSQGKSDPDRQLSLFVREKTKPAL